MDDKKNYLTIGEASEYLGVSIDTLRRWEKKGRIEPFRSPGGHRYYEKGDLDALFGKRYIRVETHQEKLPEVKKTEPEMPVTLSTEPTVSEVQTPLVVQSVPEPAHDVPSEQGPVQAQLEPISIPAYSNEAPPPPPPPMQHYTPPPPEPVQSEINPRVLSIPEASAVQVSRIQEQVSYTTPTLQGETIEMRREETVTMQPPQQRVDAHPVMNQRQDFLLPQVSLSKPEPREEFRESKSFKGKPNTKEKIQIGIIVAILVLVVILAIVLFVMLMRSSQSVLSPSP